MRLFTVNSGVTFSLHELTLVQGNARDSGGSIRGGLNSTLLISNTAFFDNAAPKGGGAIYHPHRSVDDH